VHLKGRADFLINDFLNFLQFSFIGLVGFHYSLPSIKKFKQRYQMKLNELTLMVSDPASFASIVLQAKTIEAKLTGGVDPLFLIMHGLKA
jgi:hypothetical protein